MGTCKRKIYFRADAGADIGYGHFIRSLALADMLHKDFFCVFFSQNPSAYQINEAKKICPLVSLPSDNSKFDIFLEYLTGDEIVVLDNYFFSSSYQKRIKDKGCVLVCVDDMHDKHYYADLIINQGLGYSASDYSCEIYTRFAFGLKYSLLRKPFIEAPKKVNNKRRKEYINVLVAFGGADFLDLTSKVIDFLASEIIVKNIFAVVGDCYKSNTRNNSTKITYLKNLSAYELVSLFQSVDCAILPASSMLNEALACGTNIIAGYYVDNQEHDYYMFLQKGLIFGVDDYTDAESMNRIRFYLSHVVNMEEDNKCIVINDIAKRFIDLFNTL